ncbi:exodeoxyribonuclease VII large subunit [Basilea psittacipulmonis]|uniref:exodeoxyribonuclease VII large subunit n=1 Tax=Basilea psittacipulmonis TaxID=1472345 RepID=UPI000690285B|nr:exodeoxyribonuclease VII large subunit [Basilea psittacipulmonis]
MSVKVLSVSEFNKMVSFDLSERYGVVRIRGEISKHVKAASGHVYFTLKDNDGSINAVMFSGSASSLNFEMKTGMLVEVIARANIFVPRGEFQIIVSYMTLAGEGDLELAFKRLVLALQDEGLFDPLHKKNIPTYPQTIGLITSSEAAAFHDVVTTLRRRSPFVKIILYPSLVQGKTAAVSLRQALQQAVERNEVDVLLIVRGGGSREDLWCFNDPDLARDIFHCPIPIISGVGHEVDTTICDYVADMRAATPTAAAELACPSNEHIIQRLNHAKLHLNYFFETQFEEKETTFKDLSTRLNQYILYKIHENMIRVDKARAGLRSPDHILLLQKQKLNEHLSRLHHAQANRLTEYAHRVSYLPTRMDASVDKRLQGLSYHLSSLTSRLVTPERQFDIARTRYQNLESRLKQAMDQRLQMMAYQLQTLKNQLVTPEHRINMATSKYQNLMTRLVLYSENILFQASQDIGDTRSTLHHLMEEKLKNKETQVQYLLFKLTQSQKEHYQKIKDRYEPLKHRLSNLNPKAILERGYAIVLDEDKAIRNAKDVKKGQSLTVMLGKGSLDVDVKAVHK